MKKIVAVLLCLSIIFAFAACKNADRNQGSTTEASTEEPTGKPGEFVTNNKGEIQTTVESFVVPDKDNKPLTQVVTDKEGKTKVEVVTTLIYDVETYPGAETVPTYAPGNTLAPNVQSWPKYEFLSELPKFSDKIDNADYSKTLKGEIIIIYLNDVEYDEYLSYIEKCKKAGFDNTYGINLPEKTQNGESYIYYSVANGLYVGITYNTQSAPYRTCDMQISISSYDVLA